MSFIGIDCSARNGTTVYLKMLTVKEICNTAGVTRKTLFHYDKIGLLEPSAREGKQGVKMYDRSALNRLLIIRLFRFIGFSLDEVRIILDNDIEIRKHLLDNHLENLENEMREQKEKQKIITSLAQMKNEEIDYCLNKSENIVDLKKMIIAHNFEEE